MKTKELFSEIINRGYKAEIVSMFSYSINKDKRFRMITILDSPTPELFSIVDRYDAYLRVGILNKDGDKIITYDVYPKNSNDFDFEWKSLR